MHVRKCKLITDKRWSSEEWVDQVLFFIAPGPKMLEDQSFCLEQSTVYGGKSIKQLQKMQ